jgi:hypothetical protein
MRSLLPRARTRVLFDSEGDDVADQVGDTLAVGSDNAKPSGWIGDGDEHPPGADQLAQTTRDEIEKPGHVPLLEDAQG